MRRREFLSLAGTLAVWPLAVRAQKAPLPVVGVLHSVTAEAVLPDLLRGLREAGYVEGQHFSIERRSAEGQPERLLPLAQDLAERQVAVIVAAGGNGPAIAARSATATVPIVFFSGGDPVERHLVDSLARPGGNVTGVTSIGVALESKRLELLHQILPSDSAIGALIDTSVVDAALQEQELRAAAAKVGRPIRLARTATAAGIDSAIAELAQPAVRGLVVAQSPFFFSQHARLLDIVSRRRLAAMFHRREFVEGGGLVSYGTDFADGYRKVGLYVARILGGAHPGELPVQQPTKFEFVINLKTAKILGLAVPASLLTFADAVIE